ncbi:MAG: hypothetical protein ABSH28_14885 [Acidobacteriota bacterium]|jgi:hypothetical protein
MILESDLISVGHADLGLDLYMPKRHARTSWHAASDAEELDDPHGFAGLCHFLVRAGVSAPSRSREPERRITMTASRCRAGLESIGCKILPERLTAEI